MNMLITQMLAFSEAPSFWKENGPVLLITALVISAVCLSLFLRRDKPKKEKKEDERPLGVNPKNYDFSYIKPRPGVGFQEVVKENPKSVIKKPANGLLRVLLVSSVSWIILELKRRKKISRKKLRKSIRMIRRHIGNPKASYLKAVYDEAEERKVVEAFQREMEEKSKKEAENLKQNAVSIQRVRELVDELKDDSPELLKRYRSEYGNLEPREKVVVLEYFLECAKINPDSFERFEKLHKRKSFLKKLELLRQAIESGEVLKKDRNKKIVIPDSFLQEVQEEATGTGE